MRSAGYCVTTAQQQSAATGLTGFSNMERPDDRSVQRSDPSLTVGMHMEGVVGPEVEAEQVLTRA